MAHETKRYRVDEEATCEVRCDNRPYTSIDGIRKKCFVGSRWCKERCPNHVGHTSETVECSYLDDEAERQKQLQDMYPNKATKR